MPFQLLCMTLIALLIGLAIAYLGYRMVWIILPIWGFAFGFGLGAQTLQYLFGLGFLSTITSWVVGFIVGAVFALLSYMFYFAAVAILSASFGYGLTVSVASFFGFSTGIIVWIIAVIVAAGFAYLVLLFNLQKYAVIIITSMVGAGVIVLALTAGPGGLSPEQLAGNPIQAAVNSSFWTFLIFALVAISGIVFQIRASRNYIVEEYNRF